jgi:hypothetical protein
MRVVPMLTIFVASAGIAATGPSAPKANAPVVLELFTSQGCSSCPPADALVEQLSADPRLVVITRPVTYWDRLGWKDTLAREENTILQRSYAERGGEGAGVYTPQIMVQGRYGVVGSDRTKITGLVARARLANGPAIAVRPGVIALAGGTGPADVRIVALKSSAVVRIGRGENSNRTVRYSNVYQSERRLGRWTGGTQTFALPADAIKVPGADRYAVIVQQAGNGAILAARYL